MEYIILKWLSQNYPGGWVYTKHLSLKSFSSKKNLCKNSTLINFEKLPDELKENNLFFKSLGELFYRLVLPPNTSFKRNISQLHWSNPTRELNFENRFCSLTITFQNTWQISKIANEIEPYLNSDGEKFQTHYFQIQTEANFNRFLSLTPWADKYVKWVNDMINGLFSSFDWNHYVEKRIR